MTPQHLAGCVVAITGGARGLGLATAQALAARGCRVAIGDLDGDLARAEAFALTPPGPHHGAAVDVTDATSFGAWLDEVERTLGPLDVLVNNAGIMPIGPFAHEDPAVTRKQVEINILGVMTGTRLALDRMLPRRSGHIVNLSSAAGKVGLTNEATYCATKHAVAGLGDALNFELHGSGVHVSTVMPNLANTQLAAGMHAARGMKLVEARDVAEAIVGALERPRPEVFVPAYLGYLLKAQSVLSPGMRRAMAQLFGSDKVATDVNAAARAAYHERATRPVAAEEHEAQETTRT